MYKQKRLLISLAMCLALLLAGLLPASPAFAQTQPGDEFFEQEEFGILPMIVDGLNLHLRKAQEEMANPDKQAAIKELRRSAAFLRLQADVAMPEMKSAFRAYAGELDALGREVDEGLITSADEFAPIFANILYGVAENYELEALQTWDRVGYNVQLASNDLTAALSHLQHGEAWVEHQADETVVADVNQLATNFNMGTWSSAEAGRALIELNREIKRLNDSVNLLFMEEFELEDVESQVAMLVHPRINPRAADMSLQELQDIVEFEGAIVPFFMDEADLHFQLAYDHFTNNSDMAKAAAEIRAGLQFMKLELGRANPLAKDKLEQAIEAVDLTAKAVADGTFTSADDLALTFANAEYALALHHQRKAVEAWSAAQSKANQTGRQLEAAIVHLEDGSAWAGHEIDATLLRDGHMLAEQLRTNTGFAPDQVAQGIKSVGRRIKLSTLIATADEEFE